MSTIAELIALHSDDSLAAREGHVYQVWEDGEVTLQKSGELLNLRILHCMEPGSRTARAPIELFPHQENFGTPHGYAYATREGAEAIRAAILGCSNVR